ncbi:hypothetical protein KAS50_07760, partial [bacterium]|nr:hypothetical protein [bacterium]
MKRYVCFLLLVCLFVVVWASCGESIDDRAAGLIAEPDAELASLWWPPHRNVWTPIGWKDHLFRFNVFYNGT